MHILSLRSGNKFILKNDVEINNTKYPKGLVISLISYKITRHGRTMRFLVLRAKPIIEKIYSKYNVPEKSYVYKYVATWKPGKPTVFNQVNFFLTNSQIDTFFNDNLEMFDEQYKFLTRYEPNR